MNNRSQLYGFLAVALLLPAIAGWVSHRLEIAAACLGLCAAALLHREWMKAREAVRASFEKPIPIDWLLAPPLSTERIPRGFHEELLQLGYRHLGWVGVDVRGSAAAVYQHSELPVFVLLTLGIIGENVEIRTLQFESFFEQSVRLVTTTDRDLAYAASGARNPGVRLFQLREGGTPTALDGQHVGTVRAWLVGKRTPLPHQRERLLEYLQTDQELLRKQLRACGWVSPAAYLAGLLGRRPGVLRF